VSWSQEARDFSSDVGAGIRHSGGSAARDVEEGVALFSRPVPAAQQRLLLRKADGTTWGHNSLTPMADVPTQQHQPQSVFMGRHTYASPIMSGAIARRRAQPRGAAIR
jgi:hypothetical protein